MEKRRAPLTPWHVAKLIKENGIKVIVQSSKNHIFTNNEYCQAGALVKEDLHEATHIFWD